MVPLKKIKKISIRSYILFFERAFSTLYLPRLASLIRLFSSTTYQSKRGYSITIEDPKRLFPRHVHSEIARFLDEELLHEEEDINCLLCIKIDRYNSGDYGTWYGVIDLDSGQLAGMITLNYTLLKTVSALKETLAHEYGHHWTITHCIRNHWPSVSDNIIETARHKLPPAYYAIRGLDNRRYYPDYSRGWIFCDREIIAEDYRVLFSPPPYNQHHAVIEQMIEMDVDDIIESPQESIRTYIKNLKLPINNVFNHE